MRVRTAKGERESRHGRKRAGWSPAVIRLVAAVAALLAAASPALAIVGGGPPTFFADVNDVVGATQFYDLGFFGSRAVVTNIEAGSIWNLHESLAGRVSQYIADPAIVATGTTQLGQFDFHATAVGQAIGGLGSGFTYQAGIAPLAQLWSGAIATSWVAPAQFATGFNITSRSFLYPYVASMRTGIVSGSTTVRTDVVNSSWGYTDSAGSSSSTIAIDALARENNVVVVMSAGNDGPAADTVLGPASGYNGIAVGATTTGTAAPYYAQVASSSSRSPGDFYDPVTFTTVPAARSTVDIAAPGAQLAVAAYLGHTGGNLDGTNGDTTATDLYFLGAEGTSFSAPIVAGGAALLVDAAKFAAPAVANTAEMLDARVIKAVLMTSARAPAGWSNGQAGVGGVITTTQPLDPATGAGLLDLATAYRGYLGDPVTIGETLIVGQGTTLGVAGSGGGGGLEPRGWDLGGVLGQTAGGPGTSNTYALGQPLWAGFNQISATLTWFADRTLGTTLASAADRALADLTLQLLRTDAPGGEKLIAQSIAPYGSTEFLRTYVPEDGTYALRVIGLDPVYNTTGGPLVTDYALAWAVVPEPSTWAMLAAVPAILLLVQRRRRV